ncbi:MAG: hypothetical protein E7380_04960 [Clostridiales bacterium]|nr:hypothetical protein [Clostridiales bacterium]
MIPFIYLSNVPLQQDNLAASLIYLSTALRYYRIAPRNCEEGLQATFRCIQSCLSFRRPAMLPSSYTKRVRYEQDKENCGFAEARTLTYVTRQNVKFDEVL